LTRKISALSFRDFENGVGEDETVGTSARLSEVLPPGQSNGVGGNPAKLALLGSWIAAGGPNHERDEQLVEGDGMFPK